MYKKGPSRVCGNATRHLDTDAETVSDGVRLWHVFLQERYEKSVCGATGEGWSVRACEETIPGDGWQVVTPMVLIKNPRPPFTLATKPDPPRAITKCTQRRSQAIKNQHACSFHLVFPATATLQGALSKWRSKRWQIAIQSLLRVLKNKSSWH